MILLEFKDGNGIDHGRQSRIFINPDQVVGIQEDRADLTLIRTIPYAYLVQGKVEDVAIALMLPEMAELAGTNITQVAEMLQSEAES